MSSSSVWYYFKLAASFSARRRDRRQHCVGALGIRQRDGVIMLTRNSAVENRNPDVHAEARLCHKLTPKSEVYVARTLKNGDFAMAKPCARCQASLKNMDVMRVYYTISKHEYGVLDLSAK